MWYKQQVQFAILPRMFKGIKIGYKGEYSFKFELFHLSEQGTTTSAYPYIYKKHALPISSIPNKTNNKNKIVAGRTHLEFGHGYFETAKFSVAYEEHSQYFSDLCIFKLEYKMKKNGARGRTYLNIDVMSHRKNIVQNNKQSNKLEIRDISQKIYTRRLIINTHGQTATSLGTTLDNLNQFMEVQLQDNDFFGSLCMYIGAVHLGWKIRDSKMGLCQFLCQDGEEKRKTLEGERKYIRTEGEVGKCLRELTREYAGGILEFYEMTYGKAIQQVANLHSALNKLSTQQQNPTIQNSLSLSLSTSQQNFLAILPSIKISQQKIPQYFECMDINSLYFIIHYVHL